MKYVFGPVPSRRLGVSLGINNIPKKYCTYSCVYCQVGRTTNLTVNRRQFFQPEDVLREVLLAIREFKKNIDYITFVPDGEPTLDINLGKTIKMIKENVKNKVAVITNGSIINSASSDLAEADLISVKIDAVVDEIYRKVNRPHPALSLPTVLRSIEEFRKSYGGILITETMLLEGLNDGSDNLFKTAEFVCRVSPQDAYLSVPVRPPAEPGVKPSHRIFEWYERFIELGISTKVLDYQEEDSFATAGFEDPIEGLLKIMAVHPLRQDYVRKILNERHVNPDKAIKDLIERGAVRRVEYNGKVYLTLADSGYAPKS
ncbi:MAG: radical SAM protein [Candidatus Methanomethyliales bacterium]|nr:radical SAM protein [Candidatus Methanomethylicales archaeon]